LFPIGGPRFDGPIVVLTGPHAVSAAENFMQMLVGADRVTVVGQRSAGTNGNITGVSLPGGFGFTFTGMEVLNPDGSRFHGIGIEPDVYVPLTAQDLRDGVDRDLLTAIDLLSGQPGLLSGSTAGASPQSSGSSNPLGATGLAAPVNSGSLAAMSVAAGLATPLSGSSNHSVVDSALLSIVGELDGLLTGGKKRK
jgi:hypothetical protein